MKITVLEGSPHKKGSSNMLAASFVKGAEEAGHEVAVLDVAHMDMHPCLACGYCRGKGEGECIQRDDNHLIRNAIVGSDLTVFVTPMYYFGMSAQLKMVIDRFYSYGPALADMGKKTALITAAWDGDDEVMPALEAHYKRICKFMNFENVGMILGKGCGTPDMTQASAYVEDAYQLGKSL